MEYNQSSFAKVEALIGRTLESCLLDAPTNDSVTAYSGEGEVYCWCPSQNLYKEIFLAVVDSHRTALPFKPPRREIWPYFDVYSELSVASMLEEKQRETVVSVDNLNKQRALHTIGRGSVDTIYGFVENGLLFSDGAQVVDPLLSLGGATFRAALTSPLMQNSMGKIPPRWILESYVNDIEQYLSRSFDQVWAACVHEAIRIKPLVASGNVELTLGANISVYSTARFFEREKNTKKFLDSFFASSNYGPETDPIELANHLRAAQQILDSSHFRNGAPFCLNTDQLEAAQGLIKAGFQNSGISAEKIAVSNLPTVIGIDGTDLTTGDIIALRDSDETLNYWRTIRGDLASEFLKGASSSEIDELKHDLSREWLEKLRSEKRSSSFLSQKFFKKGFVLGSIGAIGAGAMELTAPGSLAFLKVLTAGGVGFIGGAAGDAYDRIEKLKQRRMNQQSRIALERHLISLDPFNKQEF